MPDWAEVAVRTLLAVTVLFIITKILGKRQVTQLSLFEYITGITIGNLAAHISLETDSPWYTGIVSITVWISVSLLIMYLQITNKSVRDFIDGKETPLIQDGQILEKNLRKEKLALDELLAQLRKKNVFRVADVEFASIEPNGALSVLLKQHHRPLTADILGIQVGEEKEPQNVIMDGVILEDALKKSGLTKEGLDKELESRGIELNQVFLAQVEHDGTLHIDLHDEKTTMKHEEANPHQGKKIGKPTTVSNLQMYEQEIQSLVNQAPTMELKMQYSRLLQNVKQVIRLEEADPSNLP